MSLAVTRRAAVAVVLTGGTIGQRSGERGAIPDADATLDLVARTAPGDVEFHCVAAMERNSPDISPRDWSTLAQVIVQAVTDGAEGVIVLHGTDTLAYTAAALSFALAGVNRPVVITGSMLPGDAPGSDAGGNLTRAFAVAASPLAGVSVVFGTRDDGATADVLPATRIIKMRTADPAAFQAIDTAPLGRVTAAGVVRAREARAVRPWSPVTAKTVFAEGVDLVKVSPMTTAARMRRLLDGLDGVVIEGFGAGHVPTAHLDALGDFGGPVVISTQITTDAERLGMYASDRLLTGIPQVIQAGRMTSVTALVKLSWVLGQGLDPRGTMTADLVGEFGGVRAGHGGPWDSAPSETADRGASAGEQL